MYQQDPIGAAFAPSSPPYNSVSSSPRRSRFLIRAFLCALVALGALTPTSRAGLIIPTPAGLTTGDHFFVVFVDSTTHPATSTNIADYNTFIQTDASGITYPGGTIGSWQVIGATAAVNEASSLFTDTTTPVYDVSGTELSTSGSGLLSAPGGIVLDQTGVITPALHVSTGLQPNGNPALNEELGGPAGTVVQAGTPGITLDLTGLSGFLVPRDSLEALYGFAEFTVGPSTSAVPEPSSITLAVVGIVMLGGVRGVRRCRRSSASRPLG
jgi:hypothetical protein